MTGSAGSVRANRPVTVALVNDYQIVVETLRDMLSPFAARVEVVDMEVGTDEVGPADVALFDTLGGQRHALTRAKALVARQGVGHVLIYARNPSAEFVRAAEAAGVDDVIDKSMTGEELVEAIEAVAEDRAPNLRRRIQRRAGRGELTLRDRELLALLAKGLSNEQIAEELFIGIETVRTHLQHLFRRLGVSNRAEAAEHAVPLGLATGAGHADHMFGRRHTRHFLLQPPEARLARQFVADELRRNGATGEQIDLFRLAVSELAANAVAHGNRSGWTVGVKATRMWLTMDVSGGGAVADNVIFEPERWEIAAPDQPTGRGLGIVRQLMDEVSVTTWRGQVRVVCRMRRD